MDNNEIENKELENNKDTSLNQNDENKGFGGIFHEYDSHAKNDIVKEVRESFLDYSMCYSRFKRWIKTSS